MKKWLTLLLVVILSLLLVACGKSDAVKATEEAIAAIGTVSYDSIDLIENAEKLYNFLTDSEKEKVGNRLDLVDAREAYDKLPPLVPEFEDDEILALYAMNRMINDYLLTMLKNPDSLCVNGLMGVEYEDGLYIFELDYSAENGFGGTVRETYYIAAGRTDTGGFVTPTWGEPSFYAGASQYYYSMFYQEASPKKTYDHEMIYKYMDDVWSFAM